MSDTMQCPVPARPMLATLAQAADMAGTTRQAVSMWLKTRGLPVSAVNLEAYVKSHKRERCAATMYRSGMQSRTCVRYIGHSGPHRSQMAGTGKFLPRPDLKGKRPGGQQP